MKTLIIKAPADLECDVQEWDAEYDAKCSIGVRLLTIKSRSAIEIVVVKVINNNRLGEYAEYYISSPNFGVAIPSISSLLETFWITEKLIYVGMPAPDAVTVAEVLKDLGDF